MVYVAHPRDANDRVLWLIEVGRFEEALDAAEDGLRASHGLTNGDIAEVRGLFGALPLRQESETAEGGPRACCSLTNSDIAEVWEHFVVLLLQACNIPDASHIAKECNREIRNQRMGSEHPAGSVVILLWLGDLVAFHCTRTRHSDASSFTV
eukprot:505955-Pelagomonas_calceolata.AAC.7